jgi:hypothetical protein
LSAGEEADGNDDAAGGEKGRDVIDVDVEDEEEEGTKKREVQARSKIWDHFTKIKEKGVVIKGQCNYCHAEIKAHPALNGTSGMHKHFRICKRNPHKCSDDATQGVLQLTEGTSVGTWKFDPDLLRSAFAEMIIEDEEPFGFGENLVLGSSCLFLALVSKYHLEGHVLGMLCNYILSRKLS